MFVVGLTGGIATGKSSVGAILRDELAVPVLDADQVAREVVAPGGPVLERVVAAFGAEVLDADGALDRGAMRARISSDPAARQALEQITHPAIREHMASQLMQLAREGHTHAVVEAALLVETGSYRQYPVLIVVTCSPETQLARLAKRDGMTESAARSLIATQLPLADKEAVATHLVRNDSSLSDLRAHTHQVWGAITR